LNNHFLFKEGEWVGEGHLAFSLVPDEVPFNISWSVAALDGERYRAVQKVEMEDQDTMVNVFTLTKQSSGEFVLFLENEVLGVFSGEGIRDDRLLAWEFAHYGVLEGLEVYEKKKDDEYRFHAEYLSNEGATTRVEGTLSQVA